MESPRPGAVDARGIRTQDEQGDQVILTIGHSNHDPEHFAQLLANEEVDLVVDIRSQPYSRFAPHFNRSTLAALLTSSGIGYQHEPDLGGRPDDPEMYDATGHVLYGLVADSVRFRAALDRLEEVAATGTVAILCGEEDPAECHRRLLVGRVLGEDGWDVRHIRSEGALQRDSDLPKTDNGQGRLFEGGEFSTWTSTQSVSPRSRPRPSSRR